MGSYLPQCRTCHRTKKPIGRDAPLSSNYCDHECDGYRQDPVPPSYWSREEELEHRIDEARKDVEHQVERGDRMAERADRAIAERDEARALVFDLFARQCNVADAFNGEPPRYDHMSGATYQEAQAALISWGLVKREECVRD